MSAWKTNTHALIHPVVAGEATIGSITLREPDVEALEAIEDLGIVEGVNPTVKQLRGIITALADQPEEVIRRLHRDDFVALSEFVAPLLEPETTEKKGSSPSSKSSAGGEKTATA